MERDGKCEQSVDLLPHDLAKTSCHVEPFVPVLREALQGSLGNASMSLCSDNRIEPYFPWSPPSADATQWATRLEIGGRFKATEPVGICVRAV